MNLATIEQKMKELLLKEKEIVLQLKIIRDEIQKKKNEKYDYCQKINGHNWEREKEEGPYGESYFMCSICHQIR